MSELVRWADRPQAPRIHVRHDHPRRCWAAECTVPASAHLLWWDGMVTITLSEVCAGHAKVLGDRGGCVLFPLDAAPPIEVLGQCFEAELARRQAERVRFVQQHWQSGFVTINMTSTAQGWTTWG